MHFKIHEFREICSQSHTKLKCVFEILSYFLHYHPGCKIFSDNDDAHQVLLSDCELYENGYRGDHTCGPKCIYSHSHIYCPFLCVIRYKRSAANVIGHCFLRGAERKVAFASTHEITFPRLGSNLTTFLEYKTRSCSVCTTLLHRYNNCKVVIS